jgi:hypothetical protein
MRFHCWSYNTRRSTGAASACRRQISASTLCVKRIDGQGGEYGRLMAGTRKSQTIRSNRCVATSRSNARRYSADRYLATAYGAEPTTCLSTPA